MLKPDINETAGMADERHISVGNKIRTLRKLRNISLQTMAKEMGMSYSYLSGLENDKHSVSITNLQRLANYFEVDMVSFLTPTGSVPKIFTKKELFKASNMYGDLAYSVVTSEDSQNLQVSYSYLPPYSPSERNVHKHGRGQEMVLVIDGVVHVMVEAECYRLNQGDCVIFESNMEHVIYTETQPATVVIISNPPYGQKL